MSAEGRGAWRPEEEPALPARSVIASTLLGVRPPRLPTSVLVRSCGLFGIRPGTARVAISRMAAAGELVADDDGYALGPELRARQARQDLSRQGATGTWDPGHDGWHAFVVTGEARPAPERTALRRAARALRLGELREGVWMRPANLDLDDQPEALAVVSGQCLRMRAHPEGDDAGLAAALWDLDGWAQRARRLTDALAASSPPSTTATSAPWPTASCSRPRCSATSRPTPSCPTPCCPGRGPAPSSAPGGRAGTGPSARCGPTGTAPSAPPPAPPEPPAGKLQ